MVLWEHPVERYLALVSLAIIAVSLAILAGKRLTEPPLLILETSPEKQETSKPTLKIHVKGAVKQPAVYSLPLGSRIADAVQIAQPLPDADLNALNLADFLEDGQEVIVPSKKHLSSPLSLALPPSPRSPSSSSRLKPDAKSSIPTVNLNTATESELIHLPGIGPALAKRIIEYRRQIGGFKSVEQLLEVKGIGQKKLEQIRPYVRP